MERLGHYWISLIIELVPTMSNTTSVTSGSIGGWFRIFHCSVFYVAFCKVVCLFVSFRLMPAMKLLLSLAFSILIALLVSTFSFLNFYLHLRNLLCKLYEKEGSPKLWSALFPYVSRTLIFVILTSSSSSVHNEML